VRQTNGFEMREETQLLVSKQYSNNMDKNFNGDVSIRGISMHVKSIESSGE